jgi:ABC-type phosphate transport system substrate-binding protein
VSRRFAFALALAALLVPASLLVPTPLRAADEPLRVCAPAVLVPVVKRIAELYASTYARPVEVVARGSRDGIAALRAGTVDVALSDFGPGEDGLSQTTIAYAPLALVADPNVGVSSLRADDARAMLNGTIASWRSLGGRDVAIARFERPTGSATERVVSIALKLNPKRTHAAVDDTSTAIVGDVKATPGGVGIVVLPYAGDLAGVRVLAIDGHAPDADGARAGYPLLGAEFAVTLGAPTLGTSRFVAFLRSSSDVWRSSALIPVRDVATR